MDIKVITFDLDNTLWDVEPALLRAEKVQQDWLRQHRPGAVEAYDHDGLWDFKKAIWKRFPQLRHHVSKFRIQNLYELQVAAGYSEQESRTGAEQAFALFLEQRQQVQLYAEALSVLDTLSSRFTLGALTNGNADVYKTDAGDYFDFAFLAEDIGLSKPHPDMFHAALQRTGVEPCNVVHVGDDPEHDIAGARAVGMHTVWMNAREKTWPDGPPPSREISNLQQLPQAIAEIAAD
ncbi:MAG: HAD family hydrolase [Halioglobus sp.]|nr:HAD family hydrolase [Halioglobus sp.]